MKTGIDRATIRAMKTEDTRKNIERATEKAIELRQKRRSLNE